MLVQDSLCSIHTFWSNDQNILKSQNPEGGGCSFHRSLHLQPDQPAAAESGCRLGFVKFDSIGSLSCLPGRLMKVSWCIPESTRDSTVQLLLCGGDCIFIRTDFKLWLYDKHLPAVQANIFPNQRTYLQRQVSRFQLVLPLLHSCCFFGGLVSVLAEYTALTEKLLRALVLIIPFFNQNERFTPAFIFDFQARGFG